MVNNQDLFRSVSSLDFREISLDDGDTGPLFYRQHFLKRLKKSPLLILSGCLFLLFLLFALIGPNVCCYSPNATYPSLKNLPPSGHFWFGTDELGRDLFARCAYGARVSLAVAFFTAIIDLIFGVCYGLTAGYLGKNYGEWMMRIADVIQGIPYLILVILLIVIMGPGLFTIIFALALTGWINMARMIRGKVLQLKNEEFIVAAKSYGASSTRILFRHLLPNMTGLIIVVLTASIPSALFGEAFLSFLGLGVQSPNPSLGTLANDGLLALRYYPWRLFFPSVCICLSIFSLNILGDTLKEFLEEKVKI